MIDGHRRHRPTRRTFILRRLGAVVVTITAVGALVLVARSIRGVASQNPTDGAASSAPETRAEGSATTSVQADLAAGLDPMRVLLVGDSSSGGLSASLDQVLARMGIRLTTDYKISSGLVRTDFFDWPGHLRETLPASDAGLVVALFGGNDGQPFRDMPDKAVGSPEWRAEYARRLDDVMTLLTADGRTLVWVGVPDARKAGLHSALLVQNEVVESVITRHPQVIFVDTWARLSGIDGRYTPFAFDPRNGQYVSVRNSKDGFHLNEVGEEILATYVGDAMAARLAARVTSGKTVAAPPARFDAADGGSYTVSGGDTLSAIAANTGTTVAAIVAANGWTDATQVIHPGSRIKLPAKT